MNNTIKIPKAFWQVLIGLSILFLCICNPIIIGKLLCDDGKIGSAILYKAIIALDILALLTLFFSLVCFNKTLSISKNFLFSIMMVLGLTFTLFVISELFLTFIYPYKAAKYINIGDKVFPLLGHTMPKHFTFDPQTGYALVPNIHDVDQKITTDAFGFRKTSRDYDPQKPSIVFVGDSTVFGWGVEDTSTFTYLLSQKKEFEQFNIINMGVPSYSVGHISAVLKYKAPQYHPKIVFVAILWPWKPFSSYSNPDAWRKIDFDFYQKTIPLKTVFQPEEPRYMKWLPKTLLALKDGLMRINFNRQIKENLTRPGISDFTITPDEEKKLAAIHAEELSEAVKTLKSQGAKIVFYIHPYQYTVFNEQYKDLGRYGREMIIEKLKAYYPGEFLKSHLQTEPLFIDGSHLTDAGNRIYADYFTDLLQKLTTPSKP